MLAAPVISILADPPGDPLLIQKAGELARQLDLRMPPAGEHLTGLLLSVTPTGLKLREAGSRTGAVTVDFQAKRKVGRRDLLLRAVGFKGGPLMIVDATAGLGRDALILARAGCRVVMIERSPVLGALLADAMDRAAATEPATVMERMRLIVGDAREWLVALASETCPDTVCIDPMFPDEGRSALPKKEMQICRRTAGDDNDAHELLREAMKLSVRRVVVKRGLHAPVLGREPNIRYSGRTVRFDVYLKQ
jgi:16S rRNA (guanine1516-N2)-methyltransferase